MNMDNLKKFEEFKRIAVALNFLGITPILYGSLGLSKAISYDFLVDDIDILIESNIFNSKLPEIHSIICSLGYELTDSEENEFKSNLFKIGIATDGDMIAFSGVDPKKLQIKIEGCQYRVLNPEQFLATYEASNLDGYRRSISNKDDALKIKIIKSKLEK